MASIIMYGFIAILILLVISFVAIIRKLVNEKTLIATPNIPQDKAVITAFASTKIKATVDEVFDFLIKFEDYGKSSAFLEYKWEDVDSDGVPLVGSLGTFKLDIDPLGPRIIGTKLTVLDRNNKLVSEETTKYPLWLLASERVQEVVPVLGEPDYCEYRTYMTGTGLAAYYLLLTAQEELDEAQRRCTDNLQAYFLERSKHPKEV